MIDGLQLLHGLGFVVLATPVLLVCVLGVTALFDIALPERTVSLLVQGAMLAGLGASVGVLVLMLLLDTRHVAMHLGEWVRIDEFHFSFTFLFDRLSVPFAILTYLLCGVIGGFASRYLHREPSFNRFFICYAFFAAGMIATSLAGTIETLFAGWELVGLSSALLVAFFQERVGPVRNGLRVWSVYRFSDAALLLAAIALHHLRGEGEFDALLGTGPWPQGQALLTMQEATIVGLLLLAAAAGKSALVPFCGWLPRAMEGPTPSSAIYYGALSVHLGAFLLLRVSPLLEVSPLVRVAVVLLGLTTAGYAALVGRVQTDIKSALSFASLTQVGIIVAEIGLGLRYLALIHILGHACLRTLQFLRASSVLQDYRLLENAIGDRLPMTGGSPLPAMFSPRAAGLYRFALERGHLDAWLDRLTSPCLRLLKRCDALERAWTDFLAGAPSREPRQAIPASESLEDLA